MGDVKTRFTVTSTNASQPSSSGSPPQLDVNQVPNELLLSIFEHCNDFLTLLNASHTCRRFRRVITDYESLLYEKLAHETEGDLFQFDTIDMTRDRRVLPEKSAWFNHCARYRLLQCALSGKDRDGTLKVGQACHPHLVNQFGYALGEIDYEAPMLMRTVDWGFAPLERRGSFDIYHDKRLDGSDRDLYPDGYTLSNPILVNLHTQTIDASVGMRSPSNDVRDTVSLTGDDEQLAEWILGSGTRYQRAEPEPFTRIVDNEVWGFHQYPMGGDKCYYLMWRYPGGKFYRRFGPFTLIYFENRRITQKVNIYTNAEIPIYASAFGMDNACIFGPRCYAEIGPHGISCYKLPEKELLGVYRPLIFDHDTEDFPHHNKSYGWAGDNLLCCDSRNGTLYALRVGKDPVQHSSHWTTVCRVDFDIDNLGIDFSLSPANNRQLDTWLRLSHTVFYGRHVVMLGGYSTQDIVRFLAVVDLYTGHCSAYHTADQNLMLEVFDSLKRYSLYDRRIGEVITFNDTYRLHSRNVLPARWVIDCHGVVCCIHEYVLDAMTAFYHEQKLQGAVEMRKIQYVMGQQQQQVQGKQAQMTETMEAEKVII